MAATEQAREQFLHAGVDLVEGFLEAMAGFAVDLLDRAFQRFHRADQVGQLVVQVGLALALFGMFLDRSQVDRLDPRDFLADVGEL